jgi:hypothetical protein
MIKKLENCIVTKESQLRKAEKKLQDDAMAFEEFLRENDQRSVDALKMSVSSFWPNPFPHSLFQFFKTQHNTTQKKN